MINLVIKTVENCNVIYKGESKQHLRRCDCLTNIDDTNSSNITYY